MIFKIIFLEPESQMINDNYNTVKLGSNEQFGTHHFYSL